MIRVFDVEDGILKINENCLLIPELRAIVTEYKEEAIPALAYVYFMTAPDSPYANVPEEDKQALVSDDVKGTFELDDEVIDKALAKLSKLYETPTMRFYESVRKSLDNMSAYLSTTPIKGGKDGNAEVIDRIQTNAGKKIESFKKLEKIKDDEIKTAMRGKAQSGMY